MLRLLAFGVLLNGTLLLTAQVRSSEMEVVVEAARSVAFTGKQSEVRDDTQLPACWEGIATSKAVPIEVRSAR